MDIIIDDALKQTIEEFGEDRMPASLTVDAQSGCAAFLLRYCDIPGNRYCTALYRMPVGEMPALICEDAWTDARYLPSGVLLATRTVQQGAEMVAFYPNGERRITSVVPQGYRAVSVEENGNGYYIHRTQTALADNDSAALVSGEYPLFHNDFGRVADLRNALYFRDGDSFIRLTEEKFEVNKTAVNTTSDLVAVAGQRYDVEPGIHDEIRLYKGRQYKVLLPGGRWSVQMMTFLNDAIVFVGCEIPSGTQGRPRLMQLSLSGELICLSDADICYGATVGSDLRFGVGTTFAALDDQIYCIATEDERSVLKCFSKKKGWRNLCDALCTVDMFAISRKRILLTGIAPLRGAEIYELSEDDVHCCSNFRKELTGTSARPMSITVNGCEVRGFVMPPREIQPGRQYTAVLCIHGGPRMAFGAAENHDHRLFSKMGCFVVFCNPFGSDGRGYQFYEHNGVWGGEMEQHIAFLREACSRYPIDPERVAIFGGSYGGYMANCMIACKHSFRAAIVERGVSYLPWQEMLGDLPAAYKDKQFQRSGLPYPESFRGCSPLMTADTTTTPTLFIQADADRRCPMIHGQAMFRRLCANNVPARMIVFHGDNHGLNRTAKPWKRIHRWYEMEQWLWRYLLAE